LSIPLRPFGFLAIHFILECCLYNEAREELKLRLVFLHELIIEVLLFGDDTLTEMQNLQIFKSVQLYIKRTKRFTHLWPQHSPPTPSQIYICLINQSINQFHLRYKYGKTCLYYIISCFLFCILFSFFVVSPFFSFSKEFIIMLYIVFYYCWRMYYCNYLLCGEDPCKLL
jgi:hypothetical protein